MLMCNICISWRQALAHIVPVNLRWSTRVCILSILGSVKLIVLLHFCGQVESSNVRHTTWNCSSYFPSTHRSMPIDIQSFVPAERKSENYSKFHVNIRFCFSLGDHNHRRVNISIKCCNMMFYVHPTIHHIKLKWVLKTILLVWNTRVCVPTSGEKIGKFRIFGLYQQIYSLYSFAILEGTNKRSAIDITFAEATFIKLKICTCMFWRHWTTYAVSIAETPTTLYWVIVHFANAASLNK